MLDSISGGGHTGLVILLREGMAAWMEHHSAFPKVDWTAPITSTSAVKAPLLALDEIRNDVIDVLVSMIAVDQSDETKEIRI